jgi:anti-sigma regulatory factor (Ser/Thr protein kinase)
MTTVAAPSTTADRSIALTIPARADYLVLSRLALAAVCRLTPLSATDVADVKLAVTEAAADFVVEVDKPEPEERLEIAAELLDDRLVIEVSGPRVAVPEAERELSRGIIEATVDDAQLSPKRTRLIKRLRSG